MTSVAGEWFGIEVPVRCGYGVIRCTCGEKSECRCGGHGNLAHGWHYKHCPLYGKEGFRVSEKGR